MAYNYNPKDASNCLPAGEYNATLIKCEDKTSKVKPDGSGGNPMEVWTFRVYGPDRDVLVTEHVVMTSALFKVKQLAIALNRRQDFDAGTFHAEDYLNADLRVLLGVEESDGFDEKNRIAKYLTSSVAPAQPATTPAAASAPSNQNRASYLPTRTARPQATADAIPANAGFKGDDIPF